MTDVVLEESPPEADGWNTFDDLPDGDYDCDTEWRGMVQDDLAGVTAAAFPVKPPSGWFANPGLTKPTPLTIDNNGRVYGHIAAWHTSHIGLAGGVRPPRSKSNYAFYRTGVVETEDGKYVDVGQITLAGGHAPLNVSVTKAVAHYDDTRSAVMDVAAGEDRHGIWVAGALRPSVTDEQLREIRASSVSGDWRPINGKLELVAVCAVNCPGFPIPRARVAAGTPIALVAAGIEPLVEESIRMRAEQDVEAGIEAGLNLFRERLNVIEAAVLGDGEPSIDEKMEALRMRVRGDRVADTPAEDPREALRARVHLTVVPDIEPAPEELEAPVVETVEAPVEAAADEDLTWDDGLDIDVPIAAALRARVHGGG